jgi:hypothetical protein
MRARSAPPASSRRTDETDPQPLSHTNGCGEASPTARHDVLIVRETLINTWLFMMPFITAQNWKGHVYIAIWWNPLPGCPLSIMRPHMWHTTLMRAWPSSMSLDQLVTIAQQAVNVANAIFRFLTPDRQPDGSLRCYVVPPPWRASWNFGIPPQVASVPPILHSFLKAVMIAHDANCEVITECDSHISWH